jgi:predicted ATPase
MGAMITRVHLSNWKNFRSVDVKVGPRVFIVGPNASGKTNFLDALRFLRDIAAPEGSLVAAVKERRGLTHMRSLHARSNSNVLVEVEVILLGDSEPWVYELELSGSESTKKPIRIEKERITHGPKVLVDRPDAKDSEDDRLLTQTHLQQISQSLRFRPLADALASMVHVHVVPQLVRTPSRGEEPSPRDASGSDFIDQLAQLSPSQQKRALKRIQKILRIAVPRFSELQVNRDNLGRPHLEAKYAHWRPRGGWQNEQEFSDGTLRLVGLLWAIDQGSAPLMLEEPELSLHREVIRQLPRLITQAANRSHRQVIVATHAEEMLADRGIDPSEIVLLAPSSDGTRATLGSDRPEIVSAAQARVPLGRMISGITKPPKIEQLALQLQVPER